ncbi:MAG TPA: Rieske 2Fe-2S domain-containing protein [Pyrinomonadaceae bacterium]|nr:Rieske 2Fe-2S domain-containing protein [Pyrinomonadaceae bacterium]
MGTEENPDQSAESVKDSTPAAGDAGKATTADESPRAAKPQKPAAAAAGAPPSTPPTETVDKTAAPGKEVPAGAPPAARVAGAGGAARTTATPTAAVNKGVPKPVAARATGAVVESTPDPPVNKMRRRIVWASIFGFLATSFLMFLRFFLPRSIFEPSSVFRVGYPADYGLGVDTKYQQQYRIWVDKTSDRLFVIYARCTHLGCTPDWKASENKFKCPCHGSGYDSEGINFEGPAPRPMDRAQVQLDAEGQIVVNIGKLYKWPKGEKNEFNDEGSYIPL